MESFIATIEEKLEQNDLARFIENESMLEDEELDPKVNDESEEPDWAEATPLFVAEIVSAFRHNDWDVEDIFVLQVQELDLTHVQNLIFRNKTNELK